jgi:hypothetical protein
VPTDERSFHRRERIAAIARWSRVGVQEARQPFPIERAFQERAARFDRPLFQPLELPDRDDVDYHRQVSYLVDAFDSLPGRADIAFDSAWKAFESAAKVAVGGNITDRLTKLAVDDLLPGEIVEALLCGMPAQSCEYLFKRLVLDFLALPTAAERERHQPNRRLRELRDPDVEALVGDLQRRYRTGFANHRKGAMLLRLAVGGQDLRLDGVRVQLSLRSRSAVLLSGLLYTARNDRFHGESFSPFVSSAATIRTYTHPYFLFLASHSLLCALWAGAPPAGIGLDRALVGANVAANLEFAQGLFGRHWRG